MTKMMKIREDLMLGFCRCCCSCGTDVTVCRDVADACCEVYRVAGMAAVHQTTKQQAAAAAAAAAAAVVASGSGSSGGGR